MKASPITDPAKQRQLHVGLAALGLGVLLVLVCQQVIAAGHGLPRGWRHVAFFAGIAVAGVSLCIGTWCLIRSQRQASDPQ